MTHGSRNVLPIGNFVDMPEDEVKVFIAPDLRIPNTINVTVFKEDHTLANLLRMRLNDDPKVAFAAYKVAHPVRHEFLLKVQTTAKGTDDSRQGPIDAIARSVQKTLDELTEFQQLLEVEVTKKTEENLKKKKNMGQS